MPRILMIDDEAGMQEGCRRALTPSGYVVDTAPDLATGRDKMYSRDYDVYLLDLMLPDGSGLDLIDPILEHDPHAICIIITSFGRVEVAVEAVQRGAYDFLSKPFTPDELIVAVNQGVERRRLKAIEAKSAASLPGLFLQRRGQGQRRDRYRFGSIDRETDRGILQWGDQSHFETWAR